MKARPVETNWRIPLNFINRRTGDLIEGQKVKLGGTLYNTRKPSDNKNWDLLCEKYTALF